MADSSYEALKRQELHEEHVFVKEQPEDLGRTSQTPRVPEDRPASMWQMHQFEALLKKPHVSSVVFAQQDFGTESVKPTRFLMKLHVDPHPAMIQGVPQLDSAGYYLGPLPKRQGVPLIGQSQGQFKTSAAAAWPPELCRWTAGAIVASYLRSREKWGKARQEKVKGDKAQELEEGEKEEMGEIDPMNPRVPGGNGQPRGCRWKGNVAPFHDGGGLSSPGRWKREQRRLPEGGDWTNFRERLWDLTLNSVGGEGALGREAFKMAKGGDHFSLVRNEAYLAEVRKLMIDCFNLEEGSDSVAEGQPFRLGLIRGLLRAAEDVDYEFLREAEKGLPLGIINPLPRTPLVYERQTKWSLEWEEDESWDFKKVNYPSAEEHSNHLRAHLEAEVSEGLMDRLEEGEFERVYGEHRAVAALAVLVEDETVGKKRVIHDATHGVCVNHRIRCRDKVRMPGPREKRALLEEFHERKEAVLSMVGDFEKAHRRFLYHPSERGYLACKASEGDGHVYVNRLATFGVASTPYWWSRISACLIRLSHYCLGSRWPVELLLYADDLEVMAPNKAGRYGAVLAFVVMAAVGAPFKWKKQRGGLVSDWVGFTTDYRVYALGLSEKRAAWVISWIQDLLTRMEVTDREFAAGLGRLSFAALALPWEKPMLGPLYAWSSAIQGNHGLLAIPWAVLIILKWIRDKLVKGKRMEVVRPPMRCPGKKVRFWTDAKATDEKAWIGGWLEENENLKECRWFSQEVTPELAPWIGARGGNPKRMIAALEFLATIVALKLWLKEELTEVTILAEAFTDNRGNDFILKKGLSTKFPITLMVMEVSEMLQESLAVARLTWVRRDENQAADDLTNENFEKFSMEKRMELPGGKVNWIVLDDLMQESEELYKEIQARREEKKRKKVGGGLASVGGKRRKIFGRWPT